jgi:predicted secreted protein
MKRLAVVVSLVLLAAPVVAAELPYDQNLIDRALPDVQERAASSGDTRTAAPSDAARMPYDQNLIDRALPDIRK